MIQQANPVLLYDPDGYRVARADLKGRHSAGESFLTAYLTQAPGPDIYALCVGPKDPEEFAQTLSACQCRHTPRPIRRTDVAVLRAQGLLYLPDSSIAKEARIRSFLGDDAYALSGVTHTVSSREVLHSVASLPAMPVREWDALICTSKSVYAALSTVLAHAEDDLRARVGATRFIRPMMPVIPLGVHTERFAHKEADRARWRRELGLADDSIAILFFGRLSVHAKASPLQLAQAAELASNRSGYPLAIIWCGWFSDEFQRSVFMKTAKSMAPSVPFHHVDGREAAARFSIWAAADIFCSLSDNIQESFGLTVIEAMAAGLPVVASNWDGYREAVTHGADGILVDSYMPRGSLADAAYRYISGVDTYDLYLGAVSQLCFADLEQTAQALARLAAEPALRRQLGAAARRTAETMFDWKAVMPRYFQLWEEQLARRKRGHGQALSSSWKTLDPAEVFAGFPSRRLADDALLGPGAQFSRLDDLIGEPGVVLNPGILVSRTQLQVIRKFFSGEEPRALSGLLAMFPAAEHAVALRTVHLLIKTGVILVIRSAESRA